MNSHIEELKNQAIEAAIKGKWQEAIKLNEKILSENENDLDTYLRLGFAYLEIGELTKAKRAYLKALKIQPGHQIAINNLEKIRILQKARQKIKKEGRKNFYLDPNLFLDVPGKTKVVSLVNLGQLHILAKLKIGQKVNLKIKRRKIEVRTDEGEYIGALPDDLSKRLTLFIKAKSKYSCYIKGASKKNVEVFIKEEKKGRKLKHYLSFPKNFQDDLKTMTADMENLEIPEEPEEEKEELPIDLEKLAEEVEEKEFYEEPPLEKEDEEFEE